jgi:hypothetical protein
MADKKKPDRAAPRRLPAYGDRLPVACFAPPLTDDSLKAYAALVGGTDPTSALGEALRNLLNCVKEWWGLPESKRTDGRVFELSHKGKRLELATVPLEEEHKEALSDHIPWDHELAGLSNEKATGLFDNLNGPLRDCAFHLLWYVKELNADREPMTADNLSK